MATFTMDMMLNPGGGEKDIISSVSRDWRGVTGGNYDSRQGEEMPPLIHHKSYSAGLSTQIPTLPTARPSLPISRVVVDKPRDPRSPPYTWRKSDKIHSMFDMNKDILRHSNRYFNQNPGILKKDDLMFRRREECNYSEPGVYNSPVPSSNVPGLNALANSSNGSKNGPNNTVSWNANETCTSSSLIKSTSGTWNSSKGNDKQMWENRMKENAELLRLYKHGFPGINQIRLPSTPSNLPNSYPQELNDTHSVKSDRIYLNIDPINDIVNYEPLSKSIANSRLSHNHPASRIINGYKANPGIMFSSEKASTKGSFPSNNVADGNFNGTNYWSAFQSPKSPRVKVWGARSLSSLSERVGSLQNGQSKSAFTRPDIYKTLTNIADLHKIEKSIRHSNNVTKPAELCVGELTKANKLIIGSPTTNESVKNVQRHFNNKIDNNDNMTGHTTPFKSHMKRSLAIYLGVDPEIDTVQYQPLNKSLSRLHARHVFSSQYCKMQEYGRKDDRDARVQSKKKSVYSCGYDVSSINVMLQNAKKRFKCCDS